MEGTLLNDVLEQLDETSASNSLVNLVLAACEGDRELASVLSGEPIERPEAGSIEHIEPLGAYLEEIRVSGFRGIGPTAALSLRPGPGLTVVIGRNGSGKSSLAEAVELLLTGSADRIARSSVFRSGWRNLHAADPCLIEADIMIEGRTGFALARRDWSAGADRLEDGVSSLQLPGEKRGSLQQLGWADALVTYRPFLSHGELETFLGRPSDLYDRVAEVLGLDDLVLAAGRITTERKRAAELDKNVKQGVKRIQALAVGRSDERVTALLKLLSTSPWDLDAAAVLLAGGPSSDTSEVTRLSRLSTLEPPTMDEVDRASTELRAAAELLDAIVGTDADAARTTASLLRAALQHHASHGDMTCPVCSTGKLDATWRSATAVTLARLDAEAAAADAAHVGARRARASFQAIRAAVPDVTTEADASGIDTQAYTEALSEWKREVTLETSEDLREAAHLLEHSRPVLDAACAAIAVEARTRRTQLDDEWQPVLHELTAWLPAAQQAASVGSSLAVLKSAETWFKHAIDAIRNRRLEPLADRSRAIWDQLKHQSNVALGDIRLSGSATRRAVEFDVTVDGVDGAALGVMSQGEVNALALSVFLPRATLPESPFRFLVIDDPVQAMDPAKVDGLAQVLCEVASTRQVVVFTHDDRLPSALRRLRLPGRIVAVTRAAGSKVSLREVSSPAAEALNDASALTRDEAVPGDVARRAVPGLCRAALEATFADAYRRAALEEGVSHQDIDDQLRAAQTLHQIAALGLYGELERGGDVLPGLARWGRRFADAFQAVKQGAHGGYAGDLTLLISDVRDLVARVEGRPDA